MSRWRGRSPDENPGVRPVEKIELEERSSKKRIVIALVLLAVGLGFIGYSVFSALNQESGWAQIQPVTESSESVASELVFLYELGVNGRSVRAENRDVSALYTELCMDAYRIFTADYGFEDVNNLYYLNQHIGEEVTLDQTLYAALEKIDKSGSRFLFAAPFYREYKNLFNDTEDYSAEMTDPYKSEEIAEYFKELSVFTSSEEHIRIELLGDNKVRLCVSEEFALYAKENGIESFIDLYWARNAFALDYIAEKLTEKGYVYGSISSYDGFVRVLDDRETLYSFNIYGVVENELVNAARFDYLGESSLVFLRSYSMNAQDSMYYTYSDGERRHPYIDVNDGLCKNSLDAIVSYSKGKGCADVLLSMMPAYISEELDMNILSEMKADGVYSVYVSGNSVNYNEPDAKLSKLYKDSEIEFKLNEIK